MAALELDIKMRRSEDGLKFTVRIVEQRLRGGKANFTTSKGFYFSSLSCPAVGGAYNRPGGMGMNANGMLYLRGSATAKDNEILYTASIGYIEKLKAAVMEYNIAMEDIV